ncbi:hypothetical protein DFH07DRAFT_929898 [Mycena maculata]|uniref:LCCL domain-containing protein n=1 Tax=Mycena maculata TaxID=230809 RepID=A0AAD7MSH5_9AGAR|nr:hypothetical protein DFH07DRAFT_929898 [Mycena maculata]
MSVPQSYSMLDISGKYSFNKALSDTDMAGTILTHQVGEKLKQKAVTVMSDSTVSLKHYKDADGIERIEIQHHVADHPPRSLAQILTWTEQTSESPLFGKIVTKERRVKTSELDDNYLQSGWTADSIEEGVIQVDMRSAANTQWTLSQVWGIEEINGARHHVRRTKFTGGDGNILHARLVFDYIGPL